MCTLTLIPKQDGFLAGMNRDELLTREMALPPQAFVSNGVGALYPREPAGGTWIACNSHGILFALLNRSSEGRAVRKEKQASRGTIIPALLQLADSDAAGRALAGFELAQFLPFRLVGIFAKEKSVTEWRWDGETLQAERLVWAARHWFSSSLSDLSAEVGRAPACARAWQEAGAGGAEWLRGLHRSHVPAPGPFSVCVHRADAATVSYTEVRCSESQISMSYVAGHPCKKQNLDATASMAMVQPPAPAVSA